MRRRLVAAAASLAVLAGCGGELLGSPAALAPTEVPLPKLDPAQVSLGRDLYLRDCANCHGQNAEGAPNWQQPDDRGNLPAPPHDDSGHTWRHPDAQLADVIRSGLRDPFNKTPELTMPPFDDRLTDEELAAILAYFKTLWSPEHRRFQEEQNQRPPVPAPGANR